MNHAKLGIHGNDTMGYTGRGVGVAVLDTGCFPHEDLEHRIAAFSDMVQKRSAPYDDNSCMRHYRRKRRRAKWNVLRRCSWLPSDSRKSVRPPGQWLLLGCPRRTPVDSGKSRAMEHTNCKYFCRLFFSPKYGGKFCSCPRSQRCLG